MTGIGKGAPVRSRQEEARLGPDPLSEAQGLERKGRSREACSVLIRALAKKPERIDWMRMLAFWLYRDGREQELLHMLAKGPESYRRDAYLVLQNASGLARLQRFGEARKEYRRVLDLTDDPTLRRHAEGDLQWLEQEEATDLSVRAGLTRARLGILTGALALGGGAFFFWLARRREQLQSVASPDASNQDSP